MLKLFNKKNKLFSKLWLFIFWIFLLPLWFNVLAAVNQELENHPFDYALYWIFSHQNNDWSICDANQNCIEQTYHVLKSIKDLKIKNKNIDRAYEFLYNTETASSKNLAYKILIKVQTKQPYKNDLEKLRDFKNEDHWIAWRKWYESDLISSIIARNAFSKNVYFNKEKNEIDSYLRKFLKKWSLTFWQDSGPDIYLNMILMDNFDNDKWNDLYRSARRYVFDEFKKGNDNFWLEEKLYLANLIWDSNKDLLNEVKMGSMWSQEKWGLVGNMIKTSLSLSYFKEAEACLPPVEWDWILTKDCSFWATVLRPKANMLIQTWVKLILWSWSTLDIDLKNNYLKIEKDWWIQIDPNATIL